MGRRSPQRRLKRPKKSKSPSALSGRGLAFLFAEAASDRDLATVRVATESPSTSATKRRASRECVFHELKIAAFAVRDVGVDGERRCHHLAENARAIGEAAKHGGVLTGTE